MTDLNLTGQQVEADKIISRLVLLRNAMLLRKPVWDRISIDKRKKWIQAADTKDPVMAIAWDIHKWLKDNFFGDVG